MSQLDPEDGGLHRVETAVGPEHDVVVAVGPGPVVGDLAHAGREVGVRGRDHSRVAVGPEVLARVEAEAGRVAQGPGPASLPLRPVGLGGVLEDRKVVTSSDLVDGRHVRGVAVEVDGQDELRARRDRALEPLGIQGEGVGVDVDEDRRRPHQQDRLAGGDEGVGDGHDLVPGADAVGSERQVERVGAVGHRAGVGGAAEIGVFPLELLDVGPEDERRAREHTVDRRVDLRAQALELGLEVDHGDGARLGHGRDAPFDGPNRPAAGWPG